jgi:hypothetical protein
MIVKFSHKDWQSLEEGAVASTTFYGVQKAWVDPDDGILSLLLQSGWIYEHELERSWEYAIVAEDSDDYHAVDANEAPRGYFRS